MRPSHACTLARIEATGTLLLADAAPTGAGLAIVGIILLALVLVVLALFVLAVRFVMRTVRRRNAPPPTS